VTRRDYIFYWAYFLLAGAGLLIVVASNPALLLLLGAVAAVLLTMAYALTGIFKRQPVARRTLFWRIVGALPFVAAAGFLGFWLLMFLWFALGPR